MLNPVHLRTLIVVIRTGSFADAARSLGYTSSAVSQQIASLERAVRLPLFERQVRSVKPTMAAELLALRARHALANLDGLYEDMQEIAGGNLGRIRIGSFPTASRTLLPLALAEFGRARPNVEISLGEGETDELVELLQSGDVDVSLGYHYDRVPRRWPGDISRTVLLDEDLILLVPSVHPLGDSEELSLADLADQSWISTRPGTAGTTCLQRICADAGFDPLINFRSNDYDVIRAFVSCGLGIALVPSLSHVETEGVRATRVKGIDAQRHVVAMHRVGSPSGIVAEMLLALSYSARTVAERAKIAGVRTN